MTSSLKSIFGAVALASGVFATIGSAQILFSDDFDSETLGLNYASFDQWDVAAGAVDLIGTGFFDFFPGNGKYVDLEGSTGLGGTITSKSTFSLDPGFFYTLSFDLAGSQRGFDRSVKVSLGSVFNATISRASSDPLANFAFTFAVLSSTSGSISFDSLQEGNTGLILDDVVLSSKPINQAPGAVPEPSTYAMFGTVALGLAVFMKRRKKV